MSKIWSFDYLPRRGWGWGGGGGGDLKNYKRGWKYRAVAGLLKRKGSGIESGSWPFDICLNSLIMCKEVWFVGLGGCVMIRGTVWNFLKEGVTEKRGGETKILKRAQTRSRGGCFKQWELESLYGPCSYNKLLHHHALYL